METRFDIAKNEYYSEQDDGRHRLVYAHFGLAVYFGQCLEETFSIMLYSNRIINKKVKTNKEVREIMDAVENSKKTMGNFINEVKQSYNLTEELIDKLSKILERRNYLAHKYFKLNVQKFYSEIGQMEMIKYFCDFIDDSEVIDEELNNYYSKYMYQLGLTEGKITELMNELKDQEFKRTTM